MLCSERVEEDVKCSHLKSGLFFLLFLTLGDQVWYQNRSGWLRRQVAQWLAVLLYSIVKWKTVLVSLWFAHLWSSRSTCGTPVRKIAKLNVRIKNTHARFYTQTTGYRTIRKLTVFLILVLTEIEVEIIEVCGVLLPDLVLYRQGPCYFWNWILNSLSYNIGSLASWTPDCLALSIVLLKDGRLQILSTLFSLSLRFVELELFVEVDFRLVQSIRGPIGSRLTTWRAPTFSIVI